MIHCDKKKEQFMPPELLQIICEFADIKNRNGKYMIQISKSDARYDILQTIPKKNKIYCVKLKNCMILTFPAPEMDAVAQYPNYDFSDGYRCYAFVDKLNSRRITSSYYFNYSWVMIREVLKEIELL